MSAAVLALASILAQAQQGDVIAADQGVAADQGGAVRGSTATYGHGYPKPQVLTAEQYDAQYNSYSGANEWTGVIMMTTVVAAYSFMFFVMWMSWCAARPIIRPLTRVVPAALILSIRDGRLCESRHARTHARARACVCVCIPAVR